MADGQSFAFHGIHARLRYIEQQIDDVIFQQVHLINVEIPSVRFGQQSGLKRFFALCQRTFNVQGPGHAVLRYAEGQINHRGGALND